MIPRDLPIPRPRTRRIQAYGDPASGVVVAVGDGRRGAQTLEIRAALPGGEVTFTRTVRGVGPLTAGARVPLRYDRTHPSRVEIDVQTLRGTAP